MTAPARISQQDMDRAMKAIAKAGFDRARVVMDLANRRIEVIIGETPAAGAGEGEAEDYDAEDR
ncbi:hypothetical protein [Qipengyuania flava]|uniref:hypothetical protein n=1 Tax=Qipengyuania flava TaxID=192812 RepID=UPI00273E60A6|nr:hypothetical protein [Qipengyuania flava]